MRAPSTSSARQSAGITLTEILISIMILGVGLVSLATLFPIGLLRLREAQRQSRSAYLFESASADVAARSLLSKNSFTFADLANFQSGVWPVWFPNATTPLAPNGYNPLIQDPAFYGPYNPYNPATPDLTQGVNATLGGGYGLPFAYDPLWRQKAVWNGQQGVYPDWNNVLGRNLPEARFASGIGFLPNADPIDGSPPSAYGLQRLSNFSPAVPSSGMVPSIFVSPEDVVWQEANNTGYTVASTGGTVVNTPSAVAPDLNLSVLLHPNLTAIVDSKGNPIPTSTNDWRFSWMITAQQTNSAHGASFDGNVVIFESRPFAIDQVTTPFGLAFQVAGETVVEGVFGYSKTVATGGLANGYGAGADRTVLLRWNAGLPDPVVKVGDWIADVTYERHQMLVYSRFFQPGGPPYVGWPNPLSRLSPTDPGEWDALPAQRCFWYQVQKVTPVGPDASVAGYRSMVVYVNRKLDARTLLTGAGNPVFLNAALICPNVVNVIPQTFFVR
jgi:hypothetical protein